MDAQTTSPAGQPAAEPELPAPVVRGEGTANVEVPAGAAAPAGVDPPAGVDIPAEPRAPGFRERGRMRRRVRFLRKARELAYRDLGGLVFEMHRMGQRHDELVAAKLAVLVRFDEELRALEGALGTRLPVTVLREAGIAACPRCAAIHGSGDRFCPACGLPMGHHADRPVTATPVSPPAAGAALLPAPAAALATSPDSAAPPASTAPLPSATPQASATPPAPATPPTHAPRTAPPTPPAPETPNPPGAAHAPAAPRAPVPPSTPPPAAANPPATARSTATDERPTEIIRPPGAGT